MAGGYEKEANKVLRIGDIKVNFKFKFGGCNEKSKSLRGCSKEWVGNLQKECFRV
jgi:hypothetical protein